jgi:hypothetical protein
MTVTHQDQHLLREARDLVDGWRGSEPFASKDEVRQAIIDAAVGSVDDAEVDALLPYVTAACGRAGLLVYIG